MTHQKLVNRRAARALSSAAVFTALWSVNSASGVVNSFFPGATFLQGAEWGDPSNWSLGHVPNDPGEEILIAPNTGGGGSGANTMTFNGGNIVADSITHMGTPGRVLVNNSATPDSITLSGLSGKPVIWNNAPGFQLSIGTDTINQINIHLSSLNNEIRNSAFAGGNSNVVRIFANIIEDNPNTAVTFSAPSGVGTFVLGGGNSISGPITFKTSQVSINFTGGTTLGSGSLILNGGSFNMTASTGAAATNTVLHQTTFNAGTTLFRLEGLTQTQASVIDLGQIVRSPTALANIATVPGSGVVNIRGDYTLSNGIIGGWATAQNSATKNENVYDWATIDANRNIVPFTAYQTKNDLSTWGINDNININSTAILNSAANVTINSLRTAVGGVYTLSFSGAVNIASGGVLIEGSTASSVTFAGAGPITSSSGELILNSAGASKLLTISASIADPDGSTHLNLIKTQAGTVVILGSHTYSGDVYINQGTLQIDTMANTGQPSSLGTSGTIYLGGFGGPGTINFGVGANGAIVGNNTSDRAFVFGAGGAIFRNGGGTVILTGPMSGVGQFTRFGVGGWTSILGSKTYSGSTVVGAGTLDVNVIANTGQPSGLGTGADIATIQLGNQNAACLNYSGLVDASTDRPFAISAAGQSIRVENNSTPVTLTLTGPLSGASSLQKLGSGTLAISGSKTYSGSLTIGQGALSIDNAGGVGTGAAANSSTITLGSNNSATLSFTGASGNISRPFLLNPDVTGVFEATSGSLGLSGQIDTNGKALVFGGAGNFAVNGAVIGGGSLTKNGAGSLILNGTNTYSGGSTLNGGTTVIGNDTALGNTSGGITFDSGQLLASASVASARTILLNAGGGAINTSASSSFSGAISGSGNLTKLGTSTLTLSGNNTTTGNTIIQAGNLEMVGSNAWNPALNGPGVTSIQSGQLILNYSGGSSPADPSFKTKLHDSYVSGFTSGQFRAPAADARHGLGWVDDGASKVSIAFTYYGDANLDKVVDSGDFTLLSQNFNSTVGVWGLGDFNYDGFVNALDFNSIATNYGATPIPGSSLGALVPEPSAISLLALGLWVRHRKPKHRSDKAARI